MGVDRTIVQQLLDGPYRRRHEDRAAIHEGRWAAVLEARHPKPAWHALGKRREHARCLALAAEHTASEPEEVDVDLIPIWWGDNEDGEGPEALWYRAHAVRVGESSLSPLEIGPLHDDADPVIDQRVAVRARRWRVAHVVEVRAYAPGIPLRFRGEHLGVLDGELLDVVAVEALLHDPLTRPTLEVPPWCAWYEPRVDGLGDELLAEIRAMSITVDEEGNLVERAPS